MLGRSLKVLRKFHQLKQVDLARSLQISNSYLSEIESEEKAPSMEILRQYSVVFKIPISSIMLFSERLPDSKSSEKIRIVSADKILRMLEWVSDQKSVEIEKNISS